jgi:hypothetical protein
MEEEAQHTIPFTDEHIEKIREGEKHTTLRTVKKDNVYAGGRKYRVEGTENLYVKITGRTIIEFGPEKAEAVDTPNEIFPSTPAKHDALRTAEGFESIEEMLNWFRNRNYNLPQPFFMYTLEAIQRREGEENE